ncbi:MAG: hypothetical protein PHZ02_12290 [Desulfocapsaceae bacterium]|nr:hypothetical protein [Desulfocapsaceae bacterium]
MTSFHIATLQIVTPMTRYHMAILLTGVLFCTISSVLAITLKRSKSNKDKLLTKTQATLNSPENGCAGTESYIKDKPITNNIFDDNLRTAELTTRLQQPRLTLQQRGYSPATPERYCYIQSMAEKGMSAQDIASMLSLSLHEATQLVTLIRVARPQQKHNDTVLLT